MLRRALLLIGLLWVLGCRDSAERPPPALQQAEQGAPSPSAISNWLNLGPAASGQPPAPVSPAVTVRIIDSISHQCRQNGSQITAPVRKVILRLDFTDPDFSAHHQFGVFAVPHEGQNQKFRIDRALEEIRSEGHEAKSLINGGFFFKNTVLSFYKSDLFHVAHPQNSARSEKRPCLVYHSATNDFAIEESSASNFQAWNRASSDLEVFCAGPLLVRNGVNVARARYAEEQFQGSGVDQDSDLPRTGVCITAPGHIKIFVADSPETSKHNVICGTTLPQLAELMKSEDCIDGMGNDGGGSTAFFTAASPGVPEFRLNGMEDRPLPVWVGVFSR